MNNRTRLRQRLTVTSWLLGTCVFIAAGYAQDRTAAVDEIFSWARADCPGCAVAVSLHGDVVVNRAYGSADLDQGLAISPGTIFDAGSLQKQFVAAAVLLLAHDGKLSLGDDVRTHLPELPEYGHTITVDHLLTHTSGIRDWTALLMLTSRDNDDALGMILRQRSLNFPPGEEWSYTNSGVVLAREIVARVSGMTFGEFARTRMFQPLGMNATQYCQDIQAVAGPRALAYNRQGDGWRPAMMLGRQRGGGGVFTTAADLVIWANAIATNRLGAFVSQKLQEPTMLNNGRKLEYARGLILGTHRGTQEVWHTGSADGYKSYLGYFPEHDLAIAIMCNAGDGADRREFAYRIFDVFVPDAGAEDEVIEGESPPPIPAIPTPGIELKAGLFISEQTGELLELAVDRGRLRVAGGPGLVAIAEDRFRRWGALAQFKSGDAFELHFQSPDAFEYRSMEGTVTHFRRAQPYAPTAKDLEAFAGRYQNEDIAAVFHIVAEGDSLLGRLEHMPPDRSLQLHPVARDQFQFSRMIVRFVRNDAGVVVALDYSNPVLRNVRFTRLGEP